MDIRISRIMVTMLAVCCLAVMCIPIPTHASSKPAAPMKVKIVTDQEGSAGSGIRVFVKYKKSERANGYQIKMIQKHNSHPGTTTITIRKSTMKTKKLMTEGYDFIHRRRLSDSE